MNLEIISDKKATEPGSYFVANYPPFSVWSPEHVPAARAALDRPAADAAPLGLYVHIPFCRKRCKFCYFRVYTDKNAEEVEGYLDALAREVSLYANQPGLSGRRFEFVYFGGGTPSFLSGAQLRRLVDGIGRRWSWEYAREVTFECEPGTLQRNKLQTIKDLGVTRLSLGVEHFDDEVLTINGRAHKSPEIFRAYDWARQIGFAQINIDLIAGLLGETDDKWHSAVERAVELDADSVTIYQMEVPFNTEFARQGTEVAGWETKRRWVDEAFQTFEKAGYVVSSAYTLVKPSRNGRFVYRDSLWRGADMFGLGVASFSHFTGVHYQNADTWDGYVSALRRGELPLARALPTSDHQRLIRELVLQLKLGRLDGGYFERKFSVRIADTFAEPFRSLVDEGLATIDGEDICLTRAGLLRVDALLPRFFEPQHRNIRYT